MNTITAYWLDELAPLPLPHSPTEIAAPVKADDWLDEPATTAAVDDWLDIEDANAGKVKLAFQHLIDSCMRGTDRVMACDGHYLAYRPYNHVLDKMTNPRTKERMQMFLEKGFYKHLGTWDEVQIYELLEGNPYKQDRKQYIVGQNYWADIRTAAKLACERKWSDYHDFLGGMATALKGGGRDPGFARQMWQDTLHQVAVAIKQIGKDLAPTEREVNEGFVEIRRARGITGKGGMIMTIDSSSLQKVGFDK